MFSVELAGRYQINNLKSIALFMYKNNVILNYDSLIFTFSHYASSASSARCMLCIKKKTELKCVDVPISCTLYVVDVLLRSTYIL